MSDPTLAKVGWKIIEVSNGAPKFMFCGLDGSRALRLNQWLHAEKKMVKDGTSKTVYESGFHIVPEMDLLKKYILRFKNLDNKVVVQCLYQDARPKP